MVPSLSQDLSHVRATLQRLVLEDSLDARARSDLRSVERVVALVERSWARMPSYLAEDNLRLGGLLAELAGLVPSALGGDAVPGGPDTGRHDDPDELDELDERNRALRSALSQVITEASSTDPATASQVHHLSATALRAGVASRPW